MAPSSKEGLSSFVCVGAVTGCHGVQGAVLVKSFTEDPRTFTRYPALCTHNGEACFKVLSAKVYKKNIILVHFENIKNRNEAEHLKGILLYILRTSLPDLDEEEYYYTDLINLSVCLNKGEKVGKIEAVHNFGAGDILEIKSFESEKSLMIPFTKDAVPEIHLKEGYIVITSEMALLASSLDKTQEESASSDD